MKSTETRTAAVLSMEESGREPPGVGPAGGIRAGGDLVTVGAMVEAADRRRRKRACVWRGSEGVD
jgi:hypothetical protein